MSQANIAASSTDAYTNNLGTTNYVSYHFYNLRSSGDSFSYEFDAEAGPLAFRVDIGITRNNIGHYNAIARNQYVYTSPDATFTIAIV